MFSGLLSISLVMRRKISFNRRTLTKAGTTVSIRRLAIYKVPLSHNNPLFRMLSMTNCSHVEDGNSDIFDHKQTKMIELDQKMTDELLTRSSGDSSHDYTRCIRDLNSLQSNTQTLALAKYKRPEQILPLFTKQLKLSGLKVSDLNELNIIHVSGTKGKGSTCAFVESILRASGKKTGFYNSPHLVKVTERVRIDGLPIGDDKFSKYFRKIYDRLKKETSKSDVTMPSYFSFLTILAFHIFVGEKVDCAVVEVGIGGEFDPTNVVQHPVACGISTLDYDHTNILGTSIEDIAWSKAGISKKGVPVFVVDEQPEAALKVIKSRCDEKNSPMYLCRPLEKSSGVQLGIQGSVQFMNAALACQLSRYLLIDAPKHELNRLSSLPPVEPKWLETNLSKLPAFFREALVSCTWPGRCQVLKYYDATFFLDGAHTRKSMRNCLDWFLTSSAKENSNSRKILMINIIGDRNKYEILSQVSDYDGFETIIFSSNRINSAGDTPKSETFLNVQSPNSDKSMENVYKNASTWDILCQERKIQSSNTVIMTNTRDSIEFIRQRVRSNSRSRYHVLVTGSLHFVGAVSETLNNHGQTAE